MLPPAHRVCNCCVLRTQAYSMMHTAADGKLPRITAVLHVEGFHALCQHPELITKVGQAGWAWCLFYYQQLVTVTKRC